MSAFLKTLGFRAQIRTGNPLTATTPAKARKLLRGGVAKPVRSRTWGPSASNCSSRRAGKRLVFLSASITEQIRGLLGCRGPGELPQRQARPAGQEENPQKAGGTIGGVRQGTTFSQLPSPTLPLGQPGPSGLPGPEPEGPRPISVEGPRRAVSAFIPSTSPRSKTCCFNHAAKRWGANFSTVEIGKARLRQFYLDRGINSNRVRGPRDGGDSQGLSAIARSRTSRPTASMSHCC